MRRQWLVYTVLLFLLAGCEGGSNRVESPLDADGLSVPLEVLDDRPELRRRVLANPHAYFRWINRPFANAVCRRFRDRLESMPIVNLHGDAHLEQFAVTRHYAGLLDFDDTSLGPAVIDLVRFGVSLFLTARERGWSDREEELLTAFFQAYRLGMREPEVSYPSPPHVQRLRARFDTNRRGFLDRVVTLMKTMDPMEATEFRRRFARYAAAMQRSRRDLEASYFRIKAEGAVSTGIGSAGDRRALVRVEGESAEDDDDVILEMKPLRDLSGVECVIATIGDASRVILGHSRLTTHRDPFLAIVPRTPEDEAAEAYWVQSWNEHYHELDVRRSLESVEELHEIVRAIGVQLGRGHVNVTPAARRALVEAMERTLEVDEEAIRVAVVDLSDTIGTVWASNARQNRRAE